MSGKGRPDIMKLVSFRLPAWLLHRLEKARQEHKPPPSKQAWVEHVLTEGLTQVEQPTAAQITERMLKL